MSTTRLLYLTDTHLGCSESGYHLQPRYSGQEVDALFEALAWTIREERVDLVAHGGDLVDHGTLGEIDQALARFSNMDVPVRLGLGNHDLGEDESITHWRNQAAALLAGGSECFGLCFDHAAVVFVGHHWHEHTPWRWRVNDVQEPRIDPQQLTYINSFLSHHQDVPVILITHAPLNSVPTAQTGLDEPFHPPYEPYAQTCRQLAADHPNLRLALCGHNHAQSIGQLGPMTCCTTAAMTERPGLVRLITVDQQSIDVRSISLAKRLGLPTDLSAKFAWAAGDESSHALHLDL